MAVLLTGEEWSALRLSFQVAVCAALAGLPLAIAVGYLLARASFVGKWLVEVVVNLPLVLPPVVTGYLLLVCLAPRGPIGSLLEAWFGWRIVFTWWGAALASTIMSFPLMVRAARLAFQGVDPRLEMAARGLGARPLVAFFTVSLPLAQRGLIALLWRSDKVTHLCSDKVSHWLASWGAMRRLRGRMAVVERGAATGER